MSLFQSCKASFNTFISVKKSSASNDNTNQLTADPGSDIQQTECPDAPEIAAENVTAAPLTAVNDNTTLPQASKNAENPLSKPSIEKTLKVLEQLANQLHVATAATGVNDFGPAQVGPSEGRSSSQLHTSAGMAQTSVTTTTPTPSGTTKMQSKIHTSSVTLSGRNIN